MSEPVSERAENVSENYRLWRAYMERNRMRAEYYRRAIRRSFEAAQRPSDTFHRHPIHEDHRSREQLDAKP
jgi:hypothetical protein